jgi:KaiC/GvpD/RAD55 family RecA-like ATPase
MTADPLELVLGKLDQPKQNPNGWMARCPAHDDGKRSLSIAYKDGKVLLKCFAGCDFAAITGALDVKASELFEPDPSRELTRSMEKKLHGGARFQSSLTLAQLAEHKGLPVEFLQSLGWKEESNGRTSVLIPYVHPLTNDVRMRVRTALQAKEGSSWQPGANMYAYDPDFGIKADRDGYAVICEGETDTATLLYADIPAIGLPGSTMQKTIEAHHVEGLKVIFVVSEPDEAGRKFPKDCAARLKALGYAGRVLPLIMPNGAKDPSALYLTDRARFAERMHAAMREAAKPPEPLIPSLAEAIPLYLKGARTRLRTDIETLDDATRGGIPLGSYVVLAGAPGAAKTSLSVCLADRFERQGATVLYVAADEPPQGIISRFGQLEGFSRGALEDAGAISAAFTERATGRRIAIADPDRRDLTLEDCMACLTDIGKDGARVLVVDSLQTVRCAAAQGLDNPIERTDAIVRLCRKYAKTGALVVALSEMSKAAYRGGKDSDLNPLASTKGSSSIEYGVDLLLALTTVKDQRGLIDCVVAKNRLSPNKPSIRLALDSERADVSEVVTPEPTGDERLARAEALIMATIAAHDCKSRNEVLRHTVVRRDLGLNALTALADSGRIRLFDGVIREV